MEIQFFTRPWASSVWVAGGPPMSTRVRKHAAGLPQVRSDGVGSVALQTVAGVIVAPGGAGVLMAGVVLNVAESCVDVEGEGDRRVPQRMR